MVCFLTSSPVIPGTDTLNPTNSFIEELHRHFPKDGQALTTARKPEEYIYDFVYDRQIRACRETKKLLGDA